MREVNLKERMPDLVEEWHWSKNKTLETRSECNRGMQYVVHVTVKDMESLDAYLKHPQHVVRVPHASASGYMPECPRVHATAVPRPDSLTLSLSWTSCRSAASHGTRTSRRWAPSRAQCWRTSSSWTWKCEPLAVLARPLRSGVSRRTVSCDNVVSRGGTARARMRHACASGFAFRSER